MYADQVVDIGRRAVEITLLLSAPMLLASLVTGLIVSIFQAVTQINEQTLSFIPKLVVMLIVLVITGPWMIEVTRAYVSELYGSIPDMVSTE